MRGSAKPLLLFGVARSGTTPYYHIFSEYFRRSSDVECLGFWGEVTNPRTCSLWDAGDGLGYCEWRRCGVDPASVPNLTSLEARAEVIKKYHGRYFFKLLPATVPSSHREWLANEFEWIFVRRKNLFEHYLSFLVSCSSGFWYIPEGIRIPPGSLNARQDDVLDFAEQCRSWLRWRDFLRPEKVVDYEDLLPGGPSQAAILRRLGLPNVPDDLAAPLPVRQNQDDKLALFANPAQLQRDYEKLKLAEFQRWMESPQSIWNDQCARSNA